MTVAVTGAGGHIGVNLCQALLARGYRVRALVHNQMAGLTGLPVEIVRGSILKANDLATLCRGADVVIHTAAQISISGDRDGSMRTVNVEGTRHVISAAEVCGVRRLVHFSSVDALQMRPFDEPLDESRPLACEASTAYAATKAEAERHIQRAVARGLDAVVLSPAAVLGPLDFKPSLAGGMLLALARGDLPVLLQGGYDWVDVRDVAAAAVSAIESGRTGQRYLLAGGWHSFRQVARLVADFAGRSAPRISVPVWLARVALPLSPLLAQRGGHGMPYTREMLSIVANSHHDIRITLATQDLNFNPRPVATTVADTLGWFRENGWLA